MLDPDKWGLRADCRSKVIARFALGSPVLAMKVMLPGNLFPGQLVTLSRRDLPAVLVSVTSITLLHSGGGGDGSNSSSIA